MAKLSPGQLALVALVAAGAAFLGAGAAVHLLAREAPKPALNVVGKNPADLYPGCTDEVAKFCNAEVGLARLAICLEKIKGQASQDCAKSIQNVNAFMLPCGPEIQKFCADIPLGDGRLFRCVKKELAQVSADCAKVFAADQKN